MLLFQPLRLHAFLRDPARPGQPETTREEGARPQMGTVSPETATRGRDIRGCGHLVERIASRRGTAKFAA